AAGALALVATGNNAAGNDSRQVRLAEPIPRPALDAIVGAFQQYSLVALGEQHRNQQIHDFIVTLLRDPRFLPQSGDVVVEFGNVRYQSVIDRYTSGDVVAPADLARVWRDTVNILVWDAPVYARLFDTVRAVNRGRPVERRLRVLLADPPIDWREIRDRASWE